MDQSSNQTEIALRSLQLKKEQIEAFFNQHRLLTGGSLPDNQLSENVNPFANINLQAELNHQLNQQLLNQQLLNHQLSQQLHPKLSVSDFEQSLRPKLSLSPNQMNQMSAFFEPALQASQLYMNESDALKKRFNLISQLSHLSSAGHQLEASQLPGGPPMNHHASKPTKIEPIEHFKFTSPTPPKRPQTDGDSMPAVIQPPPPVQSNSAFKPVARRKDSVYSMDCKGADGKRLTYDQQFINLLNKTKSAESYTPSSKLMAAEPNRRIKSPKKSYSSLASKSPTSQLAKPHTPTRHVSLEQSPFNANSSGFPSPNQYSYRNNKQSLSNSPPNNSSAPPNSSPFSSNSSRNHLPLNHSLNYCREDNDEEDDDNSLPLDMTNKGKPKNESPDESSLSVTKKKLIKEADLGQYINKIISENAAIVEQNELRLPLNKRLNSRNSTSNIPSLAFRGKSVQPQTRMNRSISVIQPPVQLQRRFEQENLERLASLQQAMMAENDDRLKAEMLNHESPKLVSALRGQLESGETIKSTVKPVNPETNAIFNSPFYSLYQLSQQRKLSDGYLPVPPAANQLDWDNNAVKNYFNSKAPTIKVTPPSFSQGESTENPDNYSQSSIIKDLLLVSNKDASGFRPADQDAAIYPNERQKPEELKTGDQEELSCLVYVCTICNIAFRNKETLAAHQTHYCKNNQNKDLYSEVSRLTGASRNGSADDLSRSDRSKDALGILKQHLLHPNSSCLLPKKRKISEPCFSSSSLNSHSLFSNEAASFKAGAGHLDELNRPRNLEPPGTSNAVYFSNCGLEAQGANVARKISVLHPANKPWFITIKQPVFEHEHLIDLRQVPGQPAQLNNQLFHKNEGSPKLLRSDHHNSITNLTDLSQLQPPISSPMAQTSVTQSPLSRSPRITHSPVPSHKNSSNHSSHFKYIDQPKEYTLISEYLPHYERKVSVKGELKFDILARTLEEQGERAEFKQSHEEDCYSNIYKINDQVRQISSMPEFIEKNEPTNAKSSLPSSKSAVIDLTESLKESEGSLPKSSESPSAEKLDGQTADQPRENQDQQKDSAVNGEKDQQVDEKSGDPCAQSDKSVKLGDVNCTTKRPASLFNCLPKKPSHLTCSTLVSPETPRSEKKFVQCSQNGQLYTYLTKKRSTRVTFCCIYRPQPMFIEQSVEPKLSMYSNWQIFPPYEEILQTHQAPVLMKHYDSRQWKHRLYHYSSRFTAKLVLEVDQEERMSVDEPANVVGELDTRTEQPEVGGDKSDERKPVDRQRSLTDEYLQRLRQVDDRNGCLMLPAFNWMMQRLKQDRINIKMKLRAFKKKFCEESTDLTDRLMKRRRKLSRKISDEYSIGQLDARHHKQSTSTISQPKRIYIFEGGFKSNEDYVYIRGKGKGKYVCAECGIRCKKPSMLRKHIRTHTDLRPYSCLHCSFAFKTKGNLTKHMKSKAHHKKCAELGISPVPTSIDTHTQIDTRALAIQEAMERASNQPSYLNDDYDDDDDMDDMMDDEDEMLNLMDDIDDDQLDLKYGIDEDDDADEDDEEEEYMMRLNDGIDQHLHIICLRIISSNFSVNKNDPLVGLDTSNNYLGVNIGCLTNFKRLSAFSDIILPNSITMNRTGIDRLNKFSVLQEAFNSTKTIQNNQFGGAVSVSANKQSNEPVSSGPVEQSAVSQTSQTSRLFNQSDSTSLDAVKAANDSAGFAINESSDSSKNNNLINVLDNNNNLVTLSSRARLAADDSMPAIRHKNSLIGGVSSSSLASIPECLEEECRREKALTNGPSGTGEDSSQQLDGNLRISQSVDATAGTMFRSSSPELKRKCSDEEPAGDRRKRQRSSDDAGSHCDKAANERKESCSLESKGDKSINNGDVSKNRADNEANCDQPVSAGSATSGLITNLSNKMTTSAIADHRVKREPDSGESTVEPSSSARLNASTLKELDERTGGCTAGDRASKSTLTTGRAATTKNVIELNAASYLSHHKKTAVGAVKANDEKSSGSEDKAEPSKPNDSPAKRTDLNDSESSSDNECKRFKESCKESSEESSAKESAAIENGSDTRPAMQLINLSQLSADAIPKLNLDHKCPSPRPKSLPSSGVRVNQQPDESRSSSANSAKISEIDEHEVAHSLLSLARSESTTTNPLILPLKRKISQGFGSVPYHHGNYFYIGDANNRTSPAASPLTACSDEEVSRAFKKTHLHNNNPKNEKSWPIEDWKLTDKLTDRLKEEINRKFSEKGTSSSRKLGRSELGRLSEDLSVSRLNSNTKLSEKLAEIKRSGLEDPMDLTKQLEDNDDIKKLLQKVENKAKTEEEIDQNKLISIYIQNKIDKHERILNDGTLNVNPAPSSFTLNSTLNKQPAVDNCRMNICTICNKTFSEESSLRLHEHIHYFERPFRCAICQVSFRSTGHLQKHIRSVSHQNKLNQSTQFGQPSPTNPRPFKCIYCKVSFRIFGHLSKHLRSKIHIGKLEGLGKLPPGLYSLMERNRIQLNDLDTTDCETNLQSLCKLAQRLQANGDLPIAPNLVAETYSPTSHSSFVCSSAYCESSNEDSNLSSGKSIDEKHGIAYPSGLNESSQNSAGGQLPNDLQKYVKIVTSNQMNQLVVNNPLSQPLPLFTTAGATLPIDRKLKPISLIPTHLIDNFAIYSGADIHHYIPQQQFFDQQTCKHPHHLYPQALPRNEEDAESLPHGHPLPKANQLKSDSPEINVLEDSNESTRSSARLEIELSDREAKENADADLAPNCKVPKCSSPAAESPKPNSSSSSSKARATSPRDDFASIQLNSNTCSICNQVFKSAKFLQVHLSVQKDCAGVNSVEKENAKKVNTEVNTEKAEVKTKESELDCKICGKKLDDLDQFRSHAQVHSVARPFVCDVCDAGFSSKASLDAHSRTHKS